MTHFWDTTRKRKITNGRAVATEIFKEWIRQRKQATGKCGIYELVGLADDVYAGFSTHTLWSVVYSGVCPGKRLRDVLCTVLEMEEDTLFPPEEKRIVKQAK